MLDASVFVKNYCGKSRVLTGDGLLDKLKMIYGL